MATPDQPGFIPPHGNYQELLSYQKAEVVYDLTYRFCQRFLSRGDRTIDQMVQAARSGKQIIRGRKAAGWTQAELAARAGVRQETISRIETGKHSPGLKTMAKIDRALSEAGA
jgi:DNA-binding XRE family transcriptional regulator